MALDAAEWAPSTASFATEPLRAKIGLCPLLVQSRPKWCVAANAGMWRKRTKLRDLKLSLLNLGPPHLIAGGWPTVKSAVDKISSFLSISAAKISHEKRILEHLPLGMAPAYSRKLWYMRLKYSSCRLVISAGESVNTSAELDGGLAGSKLSTRL